MTARWWEQAACSSTSTRLFDPPDAEDAGRARHRLLQGARICAGCPVQADCLIDARANADSGMRAGLLLEHGKVVPVPQITVRNLPGDALERAARFAVIASLHAQGVSAKVIAERVGMSRNAVDNQIRRKIRDAA